MLILSRRINESILIGGNIRVVVIRTGDTVRLGIEAPQGIPVLRDELAEQATIELPRLVPEQKEEPPAAQSAIGWLEPRRPGSV